MIKLKPCPFCGGFVEFELAASVYNRKIAGECVDCGMQFIYQEKHEQIKIKGHYENAMAEIYLNVMEPKNAPFEVAWNRRVENAVD